MLVQNYGCQQGQPKYGFGWPRATGPAGSTTPGLVYDRTDLCMMKQTCV